MFAEYDRTHFPLVKVNISGIPSNNDFDLFLEEWLILYEEERDFMFLFDIRNLGDVPIKYCVKMSMFIYRLRKRPYQYLQKSMILLNNNNVKRLLDFISPDFVHVLHEGSIVKTGDKSIATEIEKSGYKNFIK